MKITSKISVLQKALKEIADAGLMSAESFFKKEGFDEKEINDLLNETTEDEPLMCPKCGSENIIWGSADIENHTRTSECKNCDCNFTEIYEFSHIEIKIKN